MRREYAINVRSTETGEFLFQLDCCETYKEALEVVNKEIANGVEPGISFEFVCIVYDDNDNEIDTYYV